jgi:hypothetical protein
LVAFRAVSPRFALVAGHRVAPLSLALILTPIVGDSRAIVSRSLARRRSHDAFKRIISSATVDLPRHVIHAAGNSLVVPIAISVAGVDTAAVKLIGLPDTGRASAFVAD